MDSEVRNATMVGVVLIALAAVILLSFGVFSMVKGTANEGVVENQSAVNNFVNLEIETYNDKIVTGRDVLSLLRSNEDLSIFVHTSKMSEGKYLSLDKDLSVQCMNDLAYVNYGTLLTLSGGGSIDELQTIKAGDDLTTFDNSLLLVNGVVKSSGAYVVDDNGMLVQNREIGACKNNSTVEYIDVNSKFEANLIKDITDTIIGVCFTQMEY